LILVLLKGPYHSLNNFNQTSVQSCSHLSPSQPRKGENTLLLACLLLLLLLLNAVCSCLMPTPLSSCPLRWRQQIRAEVYAITSAPAVAAEGVCTFQIVTPILQTAYCAFQRAGKQATSRRGHHHQFHIHSAVKMPHPSPLASP
jgi:hypothetical protein